MADQRFATPEEIQATWKHPGFYDEPEDERITIMSRMDPAFASLSGIDKRRVMANQEKVYARRRTSPASSSSPVAVAETGPSIDDMAQEAMYRSGLTPGSRAGAAPVPPPPEEVIRLGGLLPNSSPAKPAQSPPPAAEQVSIPVDSPFDEFATTPTMIPATKPTGVMRDVARPGPYATPLDPAEEIQFKEWVAKNKVPFDPGPQSDYDMRGYWRALKNRDQRVAGSDIQNPPDQWKTPYHPEFSTKSIFARADAPKWMGDKLIDSFGRPIKDKGAEKAGQKFLAQKNIESLPKTPLQQYGEGPASSPLDGPLAAGGPVGPGPVRPKMPGSWQEGMKAPVAQPGAWPMVAETPPAEMFQYEGWEKDPIIAGANSAMLGATGLVLNGGGGLAQAAGLDNLGQTMASAQNLLQEASAPQAAPSYEQVGDKVFSDPRWWAQTIGNGIGSMIPLMATGAGTASVIENLVGSGVIRGALAEKIIRFGPSAASGLAEGLTAGGSAYIQAKEAGATDDQAMEAFVKVATTTGATSAAAFALGPMNDSLPLAGKVAVSPLAEGTQEVLQGRGEDWGQRVYDKNHQYGAQDVENFVGGAFGGLAAAPAEISAHRAERAQTPAPSMVDAFEQMAREEGRSPASPPASPPQAPATSPAPAPPVTPTQEAAPIVTPPPPPKRTAPGRKPKPTVMPTIEDIPADIEAKLDEEEKQPQPAQPAAQPDPALVKLLRNTLGWDMTTGEVSPHLKDKLVMGEDGTTDTALRDAHRAIAEQQGLSDAEFIKAELQGAFNEFDRQYLSTVAGPNTPTNPDAKGIYGAPRNPSGGLPDLSKFKEQKAPDSKSVDNQLSDEPVPAPGPREEVVQPEPVGAAAPVAEESKEPEATPPATEEGPEPFQGARKFIRSVYNRIVMGNPIKDTPTLNQIFRTVTGKAVGDEVDQKAIYDAMETAVAQSIAKRTEYMTTPDVPGRIASLKKLMAVLPTQTTRTEGQVAAQQFSTPPPLAYIAARVAGIQKGNVVLEPSAGTGGLAAFAKAAGADVVTNEWDKTRRGLLDMQGYRTFGENAEQLHNILPEDVKPDVVLMNPPFSSSVVRGGPNSNQVGYQHVIQAMKRLKPGGRLVAILGKGAQRGLPNSANFWKQMEQMGVARADIGVNGKEYAKYGTSFDNRIVVFDKHPADGQQNQAPFVSGDYNTVEEAWDALSGIAARDNAGTGGVADNGQLPAGSGPAIDGSAEGGRPPANPNPGLQSSPTSPGRRLGGRRGPSPATGGNVGQAPQQTSQQPEGSVPSNPEPGDSGSGAVQPLGGMTPEQAREAALKKLAEEADADIAAGEKALRDLGFYDSLGSMNLDPRVIPQLVKIGTGWAKKGYVSFKRWSDAMLQQFSAAADKIRPHLRDIYDQAMEAYEAALESLSEAFQKPASQPEQKQEAAPAEEDDGRAPHPAQEEDGDYVIYEATSIPPEWGAQKHKARIVETQAMAGVQAPKVTIKPNVPQSVIDSGDLSDVQLTAISRAAHAFTRTLPNGERVGYFIGDGTGVGKGREIAGTIVHLWNSGVKKIIWASASETLLNAAIDDLQNVGGKDIPTIWIGKLDANKPFEKKFPQGIIFTTYASLAYGVNEIRRSTDIEPIASNRVRQVVDWAGPNPGIVFDESHLAKNAGSEDSTSKGGSDGEESGKKTKETGSKSGKAVLSVQINIPKAHVLYSSATGFTEPENLIYARRLGMWGEGTNFPTFERFNNLVTRGGIGAMEILAMGLKAQGLYESRFISFKGVDFGEKEHPISAEQEEILDTSSEAWKIVRQNINAAFGITASPSDVKRKAMNRYYSELQRFQMALMTAVKVPTLFDEIDESLKNNERVVVSVMLTGEAQMKRELARAKEEELSLDDLDLSPMKIIQDLVDKSFPTQQYEEKPGPNNTVTMVAVVDANGKPVENREAVAAKKALLERLGRLRMPDTAIDQIINRYGGAMVAELTGRKNRIEINPKTGQRVEVELKGDDRLKAESDMFQNGDKRIAIISPASSTGISLHASNRAKNRERRHHIILQLMWSADRQMQVFGRVHRTDQAVAPKYTLLTMNVGGEKRFASSIAKRLEQLGALSRGDRGSSGGGSIAEYNFETKYGEDATNALLRTMADQGEYGGEETIRTMGLDRVLNQAATGSSRRSANTIKVTQFLNRVQILPVKLQNEVFDKFVSLMEDRIEQAKANGTYDAGTEKINAAEIVELQKPTVVRTDDITGAKTYWYQLEAHHERPLTDWAATQKLINVGYKLVKNQVGNLAIVNPKTRTHTDERGAMSNRYTITRPNGEVQNLTEEERRKWDSVEDIEGERHWDEQREAAGKYRNEKVHLIGGSVFPIYDTFIQTSENNTQIPKVKIAMVKDGPRLLGVHIPTGRIRHILREIGFGSHVDGNEVFDRLSANDNSYTLTKGIKLSRTTIQGEPSIQLVEVPESESERLKGMGVKSVIQQFRPRYFIPLAGDKAKSTLEAVLKAYPPVADRSGAIEYGGDDRPAGPRPISPGRRESESGFVKLDFFKSMEGKIRQWKQGGEQDAEPSHFEWSDSKVRERITAAAKKQKEDTGWLDRLKEAGSTLAAMGRVYRHLPREKYGRLYFELGILSKARGMASSRSLVNMLRMVDGMSKADFQLFRDAILADDLLETVQLFEEQKKEVPDELAFGFTKDTLPEEHRRVMEAVENNETVKEAMEHRRAVWGKIRDEYIEAMDEAGEDVTGKMKRKSYYRHQVLLEKRLEHLANLESGGVKTPNRRSYLKQRSAEAIGRDYQTNFIETEMKIMTQLMIDTKVAKFVAFLDKEYNIRRDLESQAKQMNVQATMPYFEELAQAENDARMASGNEERVDAYDMFRRTLNRPQAIAIDTLGRLASKGLLPDTKDGRWAETISELATDYLAKKADEAEGIESGGYDTTADLLGYAAWVLKQNESSEAAGAAAQLFKGIRRKQQRIKEIAGDKFVTWQDIIPDDHEKMQVDASRSYYGVYSIPEKLAMKMMEEGAGEIGVTKDDLKKVYAVGAAPKPLVLPAEVVKQFEEMERERASRADENMFTKAARGAMNSWKRWQLFGPHRAIKYLVRNQTGDLDSMIIGLPWKRSVDELRKHAIRHHKEVKDYFMPLMRGKIGEAKMSPELEKFANFGPFEGLLSVQEIGDPVVPDMIQDLARWESGEKQHPLLRGGPAKWGKRYFQYASILNNWREAMNRYAVYRIFLDDIRSNKGKPTRYSASIKEEVDALPTAEEKAYRMSNDLMGAYDEISVAGRKIREWGIPFWSYQELNFKRYARLFRNAVREGTAASKTGRTFYGAAKVAPYFAYRTGGTIVKTYALWALSAGLTALFTGGGDDDKELRRDIRQRPHLTFGKVGDEVIYFPRIGNLSDILEWMDFDEFKDNVRAAWEGRKPWYRAAGDSLRSGPGEKLFLSLGPIGKYPFEWVSGKTYYPDVTKGRAIESWPEKIAQDLGMGDIFRGVTGRPVRQTSPLQKAADLVIYRADPGESAYYDILELKKQFSKKKGFPSDDEDPKREALRNVKRSLRYGNEGTFRTYLMKYLELGGTKEGMDKAIKSMAPLAGLNKMQRKEFIEQLEPEDKNRLELALEYYNDTFYGQTAKEFFASAPK